MATKRLDPKLLEKIDRSLKATEKSLKETYDKLDSIWVFCAVVLLILSLITPLLYYVLI